MKWLIGMQIYYFKTNKQKKNKAHKLRAVKRARKIIIKFEILC